MGLAPTVALIPAVIAGAIAGAGVGLLTRSLQRGGDGATLTSEHVSQATGTVVTEIRGGDVPGEVLLAVAGQPLKVSARSVVPIPVGTPVVVTAALSPTSVMVAPASAGSS
jgi:hypothetical protein